MKVLQGYLVLLCLAALGIHALVLTISIALPYILGIIFLTGLLHFMWQRSNRW